MNGPPPRWRTWWGSGSPGRRWSGGGARDDGPAGARPGVHGRPDRGGTVGRPGFRARPEAARGAGRPAAASERPDAGHDLRKADAARNLERWVDAIVARTFAHSTVVQLAEHARIPVINGLSDREHPCQTLADLLTVYERFGGFRGITLAWVGDGNNVCHSLLLGAAKVGLNLRVATPPGHAPEPEIVQNAERQAQANGATIGQTIDPAEAVRGADVIYTDVWASMGQEQEHAQRVRLFRPYQVNAALLRQARPEAVVLHCLPAHRGEEIADEGLDGPQAIVFDQAENRLHAPKALLAMIL